MSLLSFMTPQGAANAELAMQMSQATYLSQNVALGLSNMFGKVERTFCAICEQPGIHTHEGPAKTIGKPVAKEKSMYDAVKTWFNKHSDLLVTVAAIFLADHFMFGGKFRHKIEQMVDGLIDKVAKKVEAHEA